MLKGALISQMWSPGHTFALYSQGGDAIHAALRHTDPWANAHMGCRRDATLGAGSVALASATAGDPFREMALPKKLARKPSGRKIRGWANEVSRGAERAGDETLLEVTKERSAGAVVRPGRKSGLGITA